MTIDRVVVVGSSVAGIRAAQALWLKGSVTTRLAWQRGAEVADVRAALAKLSDRVTPFDLTAQKGKLANAHDR
jgi:hypothetical protein